MDYNGLKIIQGLGEFSAEIFKSVCNPHAYHSKVFSRHEVQSLYRLCQVNSFNYEFPHVRVTVSPSHASTYCVPRETKKDHGFLCLHTEALCFSHGHVIDSIFIINNGLFCGEIESTVMKVSCVICSIVWMNQVPHQGTFCPSLLST